ncbi:hypothetical protein MNEG_9862, partial [Monoraphidium neglectum]
MVQLPRDVLLAIFSCLSSVDDLGAACLSAKALHTHLTSDEFLHVWFRRQHTVHLPHTPWQYAAVSWRRLARLGPLQLAQWLAAHTAMRARELPPGTPPPVALGCAGAAISSGDAPAALAALCPHARHLLLPYAAHAGRTDVVAELIAPSPDAQQQEQQQQEQQQEEQQEQQHQQEQQQPLLVLPLAGAGGLIPHLGVAAPAPVDSNIERARLDALDLALRAALLGRRPGALQALLAHAHAAKAAAAAGSEPPPGGPGPGPGPQPPAAAAEAAVGLLQHAAACSDVECLRLLCAPGSPFAGASS